jgi:hypothetical protein
MQNMVRGVQHAEHRAHTHHVKHKQRALRLDWHVLIGRRDDAKEGRLGVRVNDEPRVAGAEQLHRRGVERRLKRVEVAKRGFQR